MKLCRMTVDKWAGQRPSEFREELGASQEVILAKEKVRGDWEKLAPVLRHSESLLVLSSISRFKISTGMLRRISVCRRTSSSISSREVGALWTTFPTNSFDNFPLHTSIRCSMSKMHLNTTKSFEEILEDGICIGAWCNGGGEKTGGTAAIIKEQRHFGQTGDSEELHKYSKQLEQKS